MQSAQGRSGFTMSPLGEVSPFDVAAKLSAVRNFSYEKVRKEIEAEPRFVEILWWLQWVSCHENYLGGLERFAEDLIATSGDLIGTPHMRKLKQGVFTQSDLNEIRGEIPQAAMNSCDGRIRPFEQCAAEAKLHLHRYLYSLCVVPEVGFLRRADMHLDLAGYNYCDQAPWYFADVAEALLRALDNWRTHKLNAIAETAVSREIVGWLNRICRMGSREGRLQFPASASATAVMIKGNSRFGKSEAVRAWCAGNPGLARLVETPPSNSELGLLRAVGKALGIPYCYGVEKLREMIGRILESSRLMLVFDEAQLLLPGTYSASTAPKRLNWVRREILDRGFPAAFIATPQSYDPAKAKFVKRTGYTFEQFDKRLLHVSLPETVEEEDLLAIARVHFPGVADACVRYAAAIAASGDRNYVSDVAQIGALARELAWERGGSVAHIDDIKKAIGYVLPARLPVNTIAPAPNRTAVKRPCRPSAAALQPDRERHPLEGIRRPTFEAASLTEKTT